MSEYEIVIKSPDLGCEYFRRVRVLEINKIYNMDCIEGMRLLGDSTVDSIVTDPPFKLSQEYSNNADADNLIAVSGIMLAAQEMYRVIKPGGIAAVFYDTRILPLALYAFNKAGWKYLRALTFYRRWGNANKLYGWMSTSDFILIFTKPGGKYKFYGPWKHDVYIKDKPEEETYNHPAQKPIDCVEHLVQNITPVNGLCLDPYIGCGTTAIAAIKTQRNFIGFELNEIYYEIACKRIDDLIKAMGGEGNYVRI